MWRSVIVGMSEDLTRLARSASQMTLISWDCGVVVSDNILQYVKAKCSMNCLLYWPGCIDKELIIISTTFAKRHPPCASRSCVCRESMHLSSMTPPRDKLLQQEIQMGRRDCMSIMMQMVAWLSQIPWLTHTGPILDRGRRCSLLHANVLQFYQTCNLIFSCSRQ